MFVILLLFLITPCYNSEILSDCISDRKCTIVSLQNSDVHIKLDNSLIKRDLWTFCYPGETRDLYKLWLYPVLRLHISNDDYTLSFGSNAREVAKSSSQFTINLLRTKLFQSKEISLTPFNVTCVGITTQSEFTVQLKVKWIEIWLVASLVFGIVLFFSAKKWSQNSSLHYLTGTVLGIGFSVLIILVLISRFIPKKPFTALFLFSGISGVLFSFHWLYSNLYSISTEYWMGILIYLLSSGSISFLLSYRFGPVTDPRSMNIISWMLQILGLVFIGIGTQIPEVSTAVIIIVLSIYNRPKWIGRLMTFLSFRFFPPKRKLLTEEEYIAQGVIETKKALEELREFCRSPKCAPWQVINTMQSPKRFTSFILGGSHITDDELLLYNTDPGHMPYHGEDDSNDQSDIDLQWDEES
ncbi:Nuclear envelope integral membrane protein 1 [Acanthosepion pharaonis]|uniref:Nuclear envelope integral membrane protein 1 n=1 Tax=Acanthosepion pharaonis TaxID=158019 RepID=A0A812E2W0_ACAPH|nr:Nuclear envelope integral membrane protein 1 [Sepia pharaonis]